MPSDWAADYVDVPERLRMFREVHPDGSLQGEYELLNVEGVTFIAYTARCYRGPDDERPGVGTAWERVPGKTPYTRDSELQNAETSAWGRAIVAALIADWKRVASREEVNGNAAAYASTADRQAITAALKTIDDTETRALTKDELKEVFGPPSVLLAEDVPAVLEHIENVRTQTLPFDDEPDDSESKVETTGGRL